MFLLKWFLFDRLITRLLRHPRVQAHPVLQQAGPLYQSGRAYILPTVLRRVVIGIALAGALFVGLAILLLVLVIQAIH